LQNSKGAGTHEALNYAFSRGDESRLSI